MRFLTLAVAVWLSVNGAKANDVNVELANTMVLLLATTLSDAEDCGLGDHPAARRAIVATRNMLVVRRQILSIEQLEGKIIEEIADYRRRKQSRHCDTISAQSVLVSLSRINSIAE